jgi:hypothetical protein
MRKRIARAWTRDALAPNETQPLRAASIAATSIFVISIIASNARLAAARSGLVTASMSTRGVICQDSPTGPAPAAGDFLSAVADDRFPQTIGFGLILGFDLERERIGVRMAGAAVESDAGNAGDAELDHDDLAFLACGIVARRTVDRADGAVRKRLRIELRGFECVAVVPEANRVLVHVDLRWVMAALSRARSRIAVMRLHIRRDGARNSS